MLKKLIILILAAVAGTGTWLYWYTSRFATETPTPTAEQAALVQTDSGPLIGYRDRGSLAWAGVPFAAPPIGELRWKAPRPVAAWSEPREALAFGSQCVQAGMGTGGVLAGDEDCLYLNVWAPDGAPGNGTDRPVMFFIHGGGNHIGEGATPIYHGARYAREHGVVVVTINYRLGPFGWFRHPSLQLTHTSETVARDNSGNYGTLDIVAALEWTQRNIAAFGGNPDNITIFGESAGGFNVLSIMVSPLAAGLYHKAIVQSGGMTLIAPGEAENYIDDPKPGHALSGREMVNRLLVRAEQLPDRAAAKARQSAMTDDEIRTLLMGTPAEEIMSAQDERLIVEQLNDMEEERSPIFVLGDGLPTRTPYIFGDGHVLPAGVQLDWLFADPQRYNVTPVILGSNRDEARLFMAFLPIYTDRLMQIPYRISDPEMYVRDTQYGSDMWKADGVDELAMRLREAQGESVYAYRFDWDELRSVVSLDMATLMGAAHAFELPFVFGNFDLVDKTLLIADKDARDALSASMMSYWAEFAFSGNPGRGRDGAERPWEPWQNGRDDNRVLLLDTEADGGIRMSPLLLTHNEIAQILARDERFTPEERCALGARLFRDKTADTGAAGSFAGGC